MRMVKIVGVVGFVLVIAFHVAAQERKPLSFEALFSFGRVADPQISPDGRWVAYSVTRIDMEKNTSNSDIWLVPVSGGTPTQLTRSEKRDNNARWSPDGKQLAFISSREGGSQIWLMDVPDGEPKKLTSISTGADGVVWSPDGKNLAFTSDVYPGCPDDACNKQRDEEAGSSRVQAKIFDRLLYRHWDSWKDGKRSHIFIVPSRGGTPKDLTPGDFDAPPFSLGGPTDYDFSPDGKELCFTRNIEKVEATSTNSDLWLVPVGGGEAKKITSNAAYDGSPQYSPDGKYIAYRAQRRPGFESDRFEIMLYDRQAGSSRSISEKLDRSVSGFAWAPDSEAVFFIAEDGEYAAIYRAGISGDVTRVVSGTFNDSVCVSRDGKTLVFTRQSISKPAEIYRSGVDGSRVLPVTAANEAALKQLEMGTVDNVRYPGAEGKEIQAWIVKPPRFTADRKWPAIVLIHGGPQGAWSDGFSYRWNLQMFAARGYVVFAPNPRGSTGFGQEFTDQISGDWGGKVYADLMNGVDYLAGLPYVDARRMAAAGASYGGYMVNWLEGHTDRFRCLVSHDGVYNGASMFGATEELWFPLWEFKGTPWSNPDVYAKWSPSSYVKNFKTPMLIVHGERDYRVPVTEGFQLFTALQLMNVPSKFLYFPDEGHWVLKPQNSRLWHKTVLDWIDQWTKTP